MDENIDSKERSYLQLGIDSLPVLNGFLVSLVLVALLNFLVKAARTYARQGIPRAEQVAEENEVTERAEKAKAAGAKESRSSGRDNGGPGRAATLDNEGPARAATLDGVPTQLRHRNADFQGQRETNPFQDGQGQGQTGPFTPTGPTAPRPMTSTPYPAYTPYPASLNPFEGYGREPSSPQHFPWTPSMPQQTTQYPFPPTHGPFMAPDNSTFYRRKEKTLDTFSGTRTELKDWLCHFEIIARYNGWTEEEKGSNLASSLRGNAQQVLQDLPVGELENYHSILQALKRRFDPEERENIKKSELRKRHKRKDETMTDYGFAISRLAKSAFPRMPQDSREELAVEYFIEGLPGFEMQQHVMFGRPQSLDNAIAFAIEYESFMGRFAGRKPEDRPVRTVKAEENKLINTMQEVVEGQQKILERQNVMGNNYKRKSVDRPVRNVAQAREGDQLTKTLQEVVKGQREIVKALENRTGTPNKPPVSRPQSNFVGCFNCKDRTHWTRDCPKPKVCHNCGSTQHFFRNCPQPRNVGAFGQQYQPRQSQTFYPPRRDGENRQEATAAPSAPYTNQMPEN